MDHGVPWFIEQKPERTPADGISPLDFAAIQGLYPLWVHSHVYGPWISAPAYVRLYHRQAKTVKTESRAELAWAMSRCILDCCAQLVF